MQIESEQQNNSSVTLFQMILGGWVQQSISVAAKLGIPDLLKDGPKDHNQLAEMTQTHAPTLYRLMRALTSVGLFTELENKHFAICPLGTYLETDSEGSVRSLAIMLGEQWHRNPWSNLLFTVQTGENAFKEVYGQSNYDYLTQNPDAGEVFNNAMVGITKTITSEIGRYDFSGFGQVIDIGGGHGALMEAILNQNPHLKGTVYDLTEVIEGTRRLMRTAGLENRCDCVAGDFFESVPSGGDAYILKAIIHNWSDDAAITILRHCRQHMHANGKLILLESVITPGDAPHPSKFTDLEMIVFTPSGKERTELEFQDLFQKAGFKLSRIIPTPTLVSIIEGIPV
jgi:hypothetical protein